MNADLQRACPFCAESIPSAARICPRCRQWLTWRSLRHPTASIFTVGLPVTVVMTAFMGYLVSRVDQIFNPRPFYPETPQALSVLNSHFNWVERKDGPVLYVTGILTNRSDLPWKDVEFECRFFDASGKMMDAGYGRSWLTLAAHDDSAFRVAITPALPQTNCATHRVTVSNARNARSAF